MKLTEGDMITLNEITLEELHYLHDSDIVRIDFEEGIKVGILLCQCYGTGDNPPHHYATIDFGHCNGIGMTIEEKELDPRKYYWDTCIQKIRRFNGEWALDTHVSGIPNGRIVFKGADRPILTIGKKIPW